MERAHPRLASPIEDLKHHYDVVVVGSGYGGAITASRLARAGRSVCVLERGREIVPGEFPESPTEVLGETQVSLPVKAGRAIHLGRVDALVDVTVGLDMNVLVGCGLGGTSLINGNVAIRPSAAVLSAKEWPRALRDDEATLARCFDRAEATLYPQVVPPEADLPKRTATARIVREGVVKKDLHLNASFHAHDDGVNRFGVPQRACVQCGNCVTGCNHAAKSTVLMNYLPDARHHGAELFCGVSVKWIEREGQGWSVRYALPGSGRETFDAPELFVTADLVVLAAGTLGTTGILLASREHGLAMSDRLGFRFSGNGDNIGFTLNAETEIRAIGWPSGVESAPVGPTITTALEHAGAGGFEEDFLLEDGAIPGALAALVPFFGTSPDRTHTWLVIGHDDSGGRIVPSLGGRVTVEWPGAGKIETFTRADQAMRIAAATLQGTHLSNPLWSNLFRSELVTVHPLGGCAMADDASQGVVDDRGRVFSASEGTAVHPGLYVSDGSMIPRSLGVNPLLTISALAERAVERMAADHGWTIDFDSTRRIPLPPPSEAVGVSFTERLKGTLTATKDGAPFDLAFIVTIRVPDLQALLLDRSLPCRLKGTVTAPKISPHTLLVRDGDFQLAVPDADDPKARRMVYGMWMVCPDGYHWHLSGHKVLHDRPGLDLWAEATTLYTSVRREGPEGPLVAEGTLRIDVPDLVRLLETLRPMPRDVPGASSAVTQFAGVFAGQLARTLVGRR